MTWMAAILRRWFTDHDLPHREQIVAALKAIGVK